MNEILEFVRENAFAIIIAFTGMLGCIVFNIAGKGLEGLYEESCSMNTTANPFLKQLKLRRENGMRINVSIHNSYAFVVKSMDKYRYLNMTIRDYVKMAWLIRLVCVMLGLVAGIINGNVWYTAYGCVCAIAVSCVGNIEDIDRKEIQIIVNIVDYFDNISAQDRRQAESDFKADIGAEEVKRNKQEMPVNAAALEEGKADMALINEEQRRLIEEVLKEYLA